MLNKIQTIIFTETCRGFNPNQLRYKGRWVTQNQLNEIESNTIYPKEGTEKVIEVSLDDNELYDENLDIKDLRKKAFNYFLKNLRGRTINKEGIGIIHFWRRGGNEFKNNSAFRDKLIVLPYIPELIKNGKVGDFQTLHKDRNDNIVGFYPIYCKLKLREIEYNAEVLIAMDIKGNLFYDLYFGEYKRISANKKELLETLAKQGNNSFHTFII